MTEVYGQVFFSIIPIVITVLNRYFHFKKIFEENKKLVYKDQTRKLPTITQRQP